MAIAAAVLCALGLGIAAHFQTLTNTHNSERLAGVSQLQANTATALAREAARLNAAKTDAIFGCRRLDVEIVQENRAEFADYTLLQLSLRLSGGRGPVAAFNVLEGALRAQGWINPVNCRQTVDREGTHYKLPAPIPFDVRLPPPRALRP